MNTTSKKYQLFCPLHLNCKNLQDVANAFNQKIVPLLQEYFYNDYSQIQLVLGNGFVNEVPLDPFEGKNGYTEKKKYTLIKNEEKINIEKALKTLLGEKGNQQDNHETQPA